MDLPIEIWHQITPDIGLQDLLSLRACNKSTLDSVSAPILDQYVRVVRKAIRDKITSRQGIFSMECMKIAFGCGYQELIVWYVKRCNHAKYLRKIFHAAIIAKNTSMIKPVVKLFGRMIGTCITNILQKIITTDAHMFRMWICKLNWRSIHTVSWAMRYYGHLTTPEIFDWIMKYLSRTHRNSYYRILLNFDYNQVRSVELLQHIRYRYVKEFNTNDLQIMLRSAGIRGDWNMFEYLAGIIIQSTPSTSYTFIECLNSAIGKNRHSFVKKIVMKGITHYRVLLELMLQYVAASKYYPICLEALESVRYKISGSKVPEIIKALACRISGPNLMKLIAKFRLNPEKTIWNDIINIFASAYRSGNNKFANWLLRKYENQKSVIYPGFLNVCCSEPGMGNTKPLVYNILQSGTINRELLDLSITTAVNKKAVNTVEACVIYKYNTGNKREKYWK